MQSTGIITTKAKWRSALYIETLTVSNVWTWLGKPAWCFRYALKTFWGQKKFHDFAQVHSKKAENQLFWGALTIKVNSMLLQYTEQDLFELVPVHSAVVCGWYMYNVSPEAILLLANSSLACDMHLLLVRSLLLACDLFSSALKQSRKRVLKSSCTIGQYISIFRCPH